MAKDSQKANEFGMDAVRDLLHLLSHTDITELLIERDDIKIHVKRSGTPSTRTAETSTVPPVLSASSLEPLGSSYHPHHTPHMAPSESPDSEEIDTSVHHVIAAPMVGTFYAAPSPRDAPFVEEGDEIQSGDTVGIIEAMKIMNEIESEVTGRVSRVMVKNGQPVEYGQPLMIIDPL
jgi:acetyl-CoA carboxylase biotin carboxyl carrier protein